MPQIVEPIVEPIIEPIAGDSGGSSAPGTMDFSQTQNSGLFVLLEDIGTMSDTIDNAPDVDVPVEKASAVDPVNIPESWASMHWKQIIALARKIAGDIEITVEDARRIIGDELATRDATESDDGLVAMTKNGDTLRINPGAVDAHKRAGWAIV